MKINPYVIARLIRAVLVIALALLVIGFLFPAPGVIFLGGNAVVITYIIGAPLIIIGIAVTSVFCTRYARVKPISNKKTERVYGIIGISLLLLFATAYIIVSVLT